MLECLEHDRSSVDIRKFDAKIGLQHLREYVDERSKAMLRLIPNSRFYQWYNMLKTDGNQ